MRRWFTPLRYVTNDPHRFLLVRIKATVDRVRRLRHCALVLGPGEMVRVEKGTAIKLAGKQSYRIDPAF